jgi:hypothetical protein
MPPVKGSRARKASPDYNKRPHISGFGVEVECGVRNQSSTMRLSDPVLGADQRFVVSTDGSITGMVGFRKYEVKFGPMCGKELDDMETAVEEFRTLYNRFVAVSGGLNVNRSCGLHIHVGITDRDGNRIQEWHNNRRIMRLIRSWRYFEPVFQSMVPRTRRGNIYCAPVRNRPLALLRQRDMSRYHTMNLHSLDERGTIEFRLPNGEIDCEEIIGWIKTILAFMNMAFAVPLRHQAAEPRPTAKERGAFLMAMLGPVESGFMKKRIKRYRWVPATAQPPVQEMEFFTNGQDTAV